MGGRGSSSATSKTADKKQNNVNEVEISKLSDSELENLIQIEAQIKEETASGHVYYLQGVPGGSRQDHERYVLAHKRYNELQGEIRRRLEESTKNVSDSGNNENIEQKKFSPFNMPKIMKIIRSKVMNFSK